MCEPGAAATDGEGNDITDQVGAWVGCAGAVLPSALCEPHRGLIGRMPAGLGMSARKLPEQADKLPHRPSFQIKGRWRVWD